MYKRQVGTPRGFSQNQTEQVTLTARNVAGTVPHTFTIYVRVGSDTFTELQTGSPISIPHNNLTGLAATSSRLYYSTSDVHGKVFVTNLTGVAQSSEEITLGSANGGAANVVQGIAEYGGNLYVLGGTSSQYVFKYRLSDGSLTGTQNIGGPSRAVAICLLYTSPSPRD